LADYGLLNGVAGIKFSLMIETKYPMNVLLIICCFAIAYGFFALVAFRIVKVLFPDNEAEHKPFRAKSPGA
jgi:hypothetical protein